MSAIFRMLYEECNLHALKEDEINYIIEHNEIDRNKISDKYHTFGELYEHRIELFLTLCRIMEGASIWISLCHHDGSIYEGWFIIGINNEKGQQISYHFPIKYWDRCVEFAFVLDKAPEWDGHTSADVLERLKSL